MRHTDFDPTEDEQKSIDFFYRRWNEAKAYHDQMIPVWRNYERILYAGDVLPGPEDSKTGDLWASQGNDDGLSRIYVPWAFQQIETQKARYIEEDAAYDVIPSNPDDRDGAKAVRKAVNYVQRKDGWEDKKLEMVHWLLALGMGVVKTTWVNNYKSVKKAKQDILRGERKLGHDIDGNPLAEPEERWELKKVKGYCGPSQTVISPYHFLWDPAAKRIEQCRYVFHRSFKPLAEIKATEGYSNTEHLADNKGDVLGPIGSDKLEADPSIAPSGLIAIVEMWTPTRLITMAVDQKVILQDVENPYWHGEIPFTVENTQKNPKTMVGIPELWTVAPFQQLAWDMDNKGMDVINHGLNPGIVFNTDEDAWRGWKALPGQKVPVDGDPGESMQFINLPNLEIAAGLVSTDAIIDRMFMVTGINQAMAGADNSATATQNLNNTTRGEARLALRLGPVYRGYARVARQTYQLLQQYITQDMKVGILGPKGAEDWQDVSVEDIQRDYDFEARSSTRQLSEQKHRQEARELLDTIAQYAGVPLAGGKMLDPTPALRYLIDQFDLIDTEECIVDAPPPAPMMPDPATEAGMVTDAGPVPAGAEMPPEMMGANLPPAVFAPQPYQGM